jgi:predicted secreted protein
MIRILVPALTAIALILPAAAQDVPVRKKRQIDPNQMVCEKEEVLGSRLAVRKVCMTRAQWDERRKIDRETVQATQTQRCVAMNGACSGAQ